MSRGKRKGRDFRRGSPEGARGEHVHERQRLYRFWYEKEELSTYLSDSENR
jgi:hypothetical protein